MTRDAPKTSRLNALRTVLRQSCNTISYDHEPWVGVRIGRLILLVGKPYGTHNAFDNHVGWTPVSIRWQLPYGPR